MLGDSASDPAGLGRVARSRLAALRQDDGPKWKWPISGAFELDIVDTETAAEVVAIVMHIEAG
jgi:hypothetical protein